MARDEQWRGVYNELEQFLRGNQHSDAHSKVLECFLNCRNPDALKATQVKEGPMNLAMSTIADSPVSPLIPPPLKRMRGEDLSGNVSGRINLLDVWKSKTDKAKCIIPATLKLYPNRTTDEKPRDKAIN